MRLMYDYITRFTGLRKLRREGDGRKGGASSIPLYFWYMVKTVVEEMAISWHVMSLIRILIVTISLQNKNRYVQKTVLDDSMKSDSWLCSWHWRLSIGYYVNTLRYGIYRLDLKLITHLKIFLKVYFIKRFNNYQNENTN